MSKFIRISLEGGRDFFSKNEFLEAAIYIGEDIPRRFLAPWVSPKYVTRRSFATANVLILLINQYIKKFLILDYIDRTNCF